MRQISAFDHRWIETSNGITLQAGRKYTVGAGHNVIFPTMLEGQEIELRPTPGQTWLALAPTFTEPSGQTFGPPVSITEGPVSFILRGTVISLVAAVSNGLSQYTERGPPSAGTTWVVTHNLNTTAPSAIVLTRVSDGAIVTATPAVTSANVLTYTFGTSQAANSLDVKVTR